ncbi:mitochondrial fission regulator 1 isoform X2 [Corythoichthys intestinalis]|uniref:mitochondrial fission regulator 1 isoform X2 n=1 Tax=Corythoichthys intestinalis TaxID=161448 RepID=UPI0025A6823D|nr:mitochondrial fission regulator 1 isoform X2 [Corythoichthys intestinalis]
MSKHYERIEMDLTFGSAKPYGSTRSIVRRIASNLPLKPCPRVHFQLVPFNGDSGGLRREHAVASLADISWIDQDDDEEEEDEDSPRSGPPRGVVFRGRPPRPRKRPLVRRRSLPTIRRETPDSRSPVAANDEAIQKIGVLETELAKLRAQIAQIVLAQEKNAQTVVSTGTSPLQPPPAPPPPPPPPPPPLPPPGLQRSFSAMDLIKERRGKRPQGPSETKTHADIPSMLDILKDMNKVKLRSVKSRPASAANHEKLQQPTDDAASLIAQALKRKFAHTYPQRNHQTEHVNKTPTESPLFGQHMLKSTGKRKFV